MTIIRGAALKISDAVVRWSSPGCKEWAEGLQREVAFIESDWRALGWAVGSMQVVLDRRPPPMRSLDEVSAVAQRLVEGVRGGRQVLMAIISGPQFLLMYFAAKNYPERIGSGLVVIGAIVGGTSVLIERRRLKPPYKDDVYDDVLTCARFYRAELERSVSRVWIPISVISCYFVGVALTTRGDEFGRLLSAVIMVLLWAVALPLVLHARRNSERRIAQLDALLAENGSVRAL
jgi:hypothetical protein